MKRWIIFASLIPTLILAKEDGILPYANEMNVKGVTHYRTAGRFGDNLISFMHAKWISYKYNLPLFVQEFPYKEHLILSEKYPLIELADLKKMRVELLGKKRKSAGNRSLIYHAPYYPECPYELKTWRSKGKPYFDIDWNDRQFLEAIREEIKPRNHLQLVVPPHSCKSVAIHIRMGGGFDIQQQKDHVPLKFPPLVYYKEQLRKIEQIFPGEELYVYLFTDHQKPEELAHYMMGDFPNISFDYRKSTNHHTLNVLEDFFSLLEFDCLVRPASNFSIVAGKLKDYEIEIFPTNYTIKKQKVTITQTKMRGFRK